MGTHNINSGSPHSQTPDLAKIADAMNEDQLSLLVVMLKSRGLQIEQNHIEGDSLRSKIIFVHDFAFKRLHVIGLPDEEAIRSLMATVAGLIPPAEGGEVPPFEDVQLPPKDTLAYSKYRIKSASDELVEAYLLGSVASADQEMEDIVIGQKKIVKAHAKLVEWVGPFDFTSRDSTWSSVRRITFELFATRVLLRVHGLLTQAIADVRTLSSGEWNAEVGDALKRRLLTTVRNIDVALNDICRNLCDLSSCDNAVLVAFLDDIAAIPSGKTRWLTIYWAMCAIAHSDGKNDVLWKTAAHILNDLAPTADQLTPSNMSLFTRDQPLKDRMKSLLTGTNPGSSAAMKSAVQGIENLFPISTALQS